MAINPPYLFVGGFPRSGTSLLSSLLGNVSGVAVVQDLCLFYYLKQAALRCMGIANGMNDQEASNWALWNHHQFDLRQTEFIHDFLDNSPLDNLNAPAALRGKILRKHVALMDHFLFVDLNISDPRKDRGQGSSYLRNLKLSQILDCGTMVDAYASFLRASAEMLSVNTGSPIKLVCDKTPENVNTSDLMDLCFRDDGYRFLLIVRDPVGVFGARRQRTNQSPDAFAEFFKVRAEPLFNMTSCVASAVVRYEDLLKEPESQLSRVFDELNIPDIAENMYFSSGINPGKYAKYVGLRINPGRDVSNRSKVSESEQKIIYEVLGEYSEKFHYGPYSVS